MEFNKDDALRAKDLAEKKLLEKDIEGAQKLAIKAHNLFPSLEGLSQLISIIDVYVCAEKRISGEVDLYRVLGVEPSADDETIRKSYRKLALNLHPDKNKSVGAEGVFKIVSEAWSLLSDKDKRAAYDQKRNLRATYEKVMLKCSTPAGKNGFDSNLVNQQKTSNPQPTQVYPPRPSKPNTFWTSCARCSMHYEYLRNYLHRKLLCPNCRQPFLAIEIPNPSGNRNTSTVGGPSKSGTGESSVKLKRGCEAEKAAGEEGALQMKKKVDGSAKKRRVDEHKWNSNNRDSTHPMANGKGSAGGERVILSSRNKPNSTRELSSSETRNMLMTKALNEIRKKLDEWHLTSKEQARRVQKDNKDNADAPSVDSKKAYVNRSSLKQSSKPSVVDLDVEPPETMTMAVPDPDFHDFDLDRTEKSFGENEVWAAYDDDDGMPRFYALIHRVISKRPFRLKMGWLNSKTNAELGPMNWVGSGFQKTSGNFYIGKHEVNRTLNAFSHKIKFTRAKGVIRIFPAKGDVWALYKNWSPDWNEHTAEDLVHKYEMVLVLEDYSEEQGVVVSPLAKVAGFKSVFHQELDLRDALKIPREEVFRFSHQVPFCLLTGKEAKHVPEGCLELDPAALPSELLQIITEDKSVEKVDNFKEELPESSKKTEGKRVITYSRRRVRKNNEEGKGKEGAGAGNIFIEKQVVGSG